jgi:hypothetical protein
VSSFGFLEITPAIERRTTTTTTKPLVLVFEIDVIHMPMGA